MNDPAFVKYLESNNSTKILLDSVMLSSKKTNRPIQKIIPGTYKWYLKENGISIEDIEIDY